MHSARQSFVNAEFATPMIFKKMRNIKNKKIKKENGAECNVI